MNVFQVEQYLCENGVELRDYEAVFEDVETLVSEKPSKASTESTGNNVHTNGSENDEKSASAERPEDPSNTTVEGSPDDTRSALIWIDPGTCSYAVYSRVAADRVALQQSPIALAKALKVDICEFMVTVLPAISICSCF